MIAKISQSFDETFKTSLSSIFKWLNMFQTKEKKTHDFRKYEQGVDFFVDFYDSYSSAKMVTLILVKQEEKIILQDRGLTIIYFVEAVEYYANSNAIQEVSLKIINLINSN